MSSRVLSSLLCAALIGLAGPAGALARPTGGRPAHRAARHHRAVRRHPRPARPPRAKRRSTPARSAAAAPSGAQPRIPIAVPAPPSLPTTTTPAPTPPPPVATGPRPLGVPGNWTLKFDDEFGAGALDRTTWEPNFLAWSGALITPGDNADDIDCLDPAQVLESGGVLHLAAAARSCTAVTGASYPYATGLVNTKGTFEFSYGYMEARIDVPATTAGTPANFPAFWATGDGPWPASGEIDVMEILRECGDQPGFHLHNGLGTFGGCADLPSPGGWHTFGADWQPGSITFYYDGVRVGQVSTGVTSVPEYLLLDNSIDPTLGGPTLAPADLQVDYVRVWQ